MTPEEYTKQLEETVANLEDELHEIKAHHRSLRRGCKVYDDILCSVVQKWVEQLHTNMKNKAKTQKKIAQTLKAASKELECLLEGSENYSQGLVRLQILINRSEPPVADFFDNGAPKALREMLSEIPSYEE